MFWRLVPAFAVFAAGWCSMSAAPPVGYYASAEGKAGAQLRAALHVILTNAGVIPYSSTGLDTSDALKVLDEDPANTNDVILIYARRSEPKSTFGLTTGWNREHLWANSYGIDSTGPAYSDLHHLRAADATVNSTRGNKFFDRSDTNSAGYRNPGSPEASLTTADSDSWEPPDVVKGDIARALFYMAVRYTGDRTNEPALFLTDTTAQITSTTNLMGRLSTLLAWHLADPVDDAERQRNDAVFTRYQHNRNPFVDRPEWVAAAFWPALRVVRSQQAVTVSWPAEYSAAVVEASGSMFGGWAVVTNVPTLNGTVWNLTRPASNALGLFRLRLQ